ncbi:serine acetyltransferase [uncultured Faecalicoccus sp.]|uniref:serine acetyltransferase n=1 Tax=uncultured Faecalicoccus sp. TaxID=1971760 RepID=UPI0025832F7D|nr:serine acetyltransferase [uncultured Faecalicoccus sp.]
MNLKYDTNYKQKIEYDRKFNEAFRGHLSKEFLNGYEWKYICTYRKFQANIHTVWRRYFAWKLKKLENKTGLSFENNTSIGEGLIIGHWGKIVINGQVKFGNQMFITHGVTIGRDIRGKRAGVPTFGDRVCIRTNSTIVGKVNIGNDVLIAPNTFVNFDVPDHSIVIGNPAKIIHRNNATEGHIPEL